jgi:hypothetical protein
LSFWSQFQKVEPPSVEDEGDALVLVQPFKHRLRERAENRLESLAARRRLCVRHDWLTVRLRQRINMSSVRNDGLT